MYKYITFLFPLKCLTLVLSLFNIYLLYVHVYVLEYMCVHHMCAGASGGQKRSRIPWNLSYSWL